MRSWTRFAIWAALIDCYAPLAIEHVETFSLAR